MKLTKIKVFERRKPSQLLIRLSRMLV